MYICVSKNFSPADIKRDLEQVKTGAYALGKSSPCTCKLDRSKNCQHFNLTKITEKKAAA